MNLKTAINQPTATIIDVRESFEYFFGHVKGAANIPLSSIPSRVDEFRKMDQPIILYCRSGNRSGQATSFLKANGIKQVYNGGSLGDVKALLNAKASV